MIVCKQLEIKQLAMLVRLGDAKSDTRARITMLSEYIRSITRA